MSDKCCEDCGDEVEGRRVRCPNCGQLLCSWCYHHSHKVFAMMAQSNNASRRTATNGGGSATNSTQPIEGTGGKGYSHRR